MGKPAQTMLLAQFHEVVAGLRQAAVPFLQLLMPVSQGQIALGGRPRGGQIARRHFPDGNCE